MQIRLILAASAALAAGCGGGARPAPAAPVGSRPAPVSTPAPAVSGDTVGTEHPLVVEAVARDGGWVAICQAREDTDGDGEVGVHVGLHGDTYGDRLRPYVVRGGGPGEPIDSLVGHGGGGRWLVALRGGALAVLDARAGTWTTLPGADLRDDGVPLGPHRAASIGRRGAYMTYLRDDETIVVRELATGSEREVKVAGARVWRVQIEGAGDGARVYVLRKDTDGDGAITWPSVRTSLSDRDCRGPITSYSTGGWSGDRPDEQWLELATGTLAAAPPADAGEEEEEEEPLGQVDGRAVLAVDAAGRKLLAPADDGRSIPRGPLRWVSP